MSCRKSISTLAFTSSLNKFPLLLGYFMCIILFLSLIDTASSASDKFDRRLHSKIRRQLFSPNMAAKYVNPSRPSYGFNEEKRDPLFENLSTEELYRMLQLIDMAADNIPVSASDRELFKLNMLLENAGIQANP